MIQNADGQTLDLNQTLRNSVTRKKCNFIIWSVVLGLKTNPPTEYPARHPVVEIAGYPATCAIETF